MSKTVVLEQELPSYLKEFIKDDIQCRLIFSQPSDSNSPISLFPTITACPNVQIETPSYQDLNKTPEFEPCINDETVIDDGMLRIKLDESSLDIEVNPSPHKSCTGQLTVEEQHHPLDENEARVLLGSKYNKISSEIPTFCIIKKENCQNEPEQILIGGQKTADFIRSYAVFAYRNKLMDGDCVKWNRWEKTILKQNYASMEYTFRRIYNIYSPEMENDMASMILETCWHMPVEEEPSFFEKNLKLKMQLVSGHQKSTITLLWEELKHLETYLKILDDEDALKVGSTVISDKHSVASEIVEKIRSLCTRPTRRRKNAIVLHVDDLREWTILDRLWSILIRCKTLIDLGNCLSMFFTLSKIENLMNKDRAVDLIKDLYNQDLTPSESLKFLVAIGFEKLKNDHLAIVSFYNPIHQVGLEKIWSKYSLGKKPELRRKSMAPNQPRYYALTDATFNKEKMAFLRKLHDASEFVMFLKNNVMESVKLSDYNFEKISNEVYQKFILENDGEISSEPLASKAVGITCYLDSRNEELYKIRTPMKKIYETKTKMRNNKTNKDESVHTILVSQSPIFPECMCEGSKDCKTLPELENCYYVAVFKMTKFGLF